MKNKMLRSGVLKTVKEYALISVGLVLYSFAWIGILMPADVVGGGINGVGLLIYYATGGECKHFFAPFYGKPLPFTFGPGVAIIIPFYRFFGGPFCWTNDTKAFFTLFFRRSSSR